MADTPDEGGRPPESSGSSRRLCGESFSRGCRIVGSESEAPEVVVNASVLRVVRIHEVHQPPDHLVHDLVS